MKIEELIENAEVSPTLYVANRDFDLHPEVEYKGYVLGSTDESDDDVYKTSYGVYRFAKTTSYEWNGRKYDQDNYQYVLPVKDPAYDGKHDLSPYHRGDIMPAFKYTVDGLQSGQFSPWKIPVARMESDTISQGDSIMFEGDTKVLVGTVLEVSGDRLVIEGKTVSLGKEDLEEGIGKWAAIAGLVGLMGYGAGQMLDPGAAKRTPLGQAMAAAAAKGDRYAAKELEKLGMYMDVGAYDQLAGLKDTYLDTPEGQKYKVKEDATNDRRSFTVRMEFEDGGKVTRVFLAKDKAEALSKAMKWAKNEYDAEQGVEARIIAEDDSKRKDNRLWLMIDDYEQRARKTKNDIKRNHYMRMAAELRDKLATVDESDAASAITRAFGGMAASVKTGLIRRAGLLAMQGRHSEAENTIRHLLKDVDTAVADKIRKSINNVKPVKVGDRVADTSAIEKSKAHTDWLDKTFVPWVENLIGSSVKESIGLGKEIVIASPDNMEHYDTMLAISREIWYLLHKNDNEEIDPYEPIVFDPKEEKLFNHWDDEGRKLGYEPAIEIDDYPFPDVNWEDSEKVYKFRRKDLEQDQRFRNTVNEAEYHGRKVQLGKPMAGDVKKYKVYVKDPKTGNIKKVNFGDKGMEIKRDNPERRRNFRARHGCGTPRASNRTKAAYWSCRMWSSKPVSKILKGK